MNAGAIAASLTAAGIIVAIVLVAKDLNAELTRDERASKDDDETEPHTSLTSARADRTPITAEQLRHDLDKSIADLRSEIVARERMAVIGRSHHEW